MPNIALLNKLLLLLAGASSDYIIVNKNLLRSLLHSLPPDSLRQLADGLGGNMGPNLDALDLNSPFAHVALKDIRKNFKITQGELASAAKLKQPDISALEAKGAEAAGFSIERLERVKESLGKLIQTKSTRTIPE